MAQGRSACLDSLWYNAFRWLETVDAHSGYDFPFSPFSMFKIFGGALFHDYHHSGDGFFGNYGATIIWDRLMDTEAKSWKARRLGLEKA